MALVVIMAVLTPALIVEESCTHLHPCRSLLSLSSWVGWSCPMVMDRRDGRLPRSPPGLPGLCRVVAWLGRRWPQADYAPGVCGEEILGVPVAERGVGAGEPAECADARGSVDHFASTCMPPVVVSAGVDPGRRW
jgi:hypothetical protein